MTWPEGAISDFVSLLRFSAVVQPAFCLNPDFNVDNKDQSCRLLAGFGGRCREGGARFDTRAEAAYDRSARNVLQGGHAACITPSRLGQGFTNHVK
jgi:hypothetical protein